MEMENYNEICIEGKESFSNLFEIIGNAYFKY